MAAAVDPRSMGPLQRAYSQRNTADAAPKAAADPLDESKHLDHIPEDSLEEDVTGSSHAAISSFLRSSQVRGYELRSIREHRCCSLCAPSRIVWRGCVCVRAHRHAEATRRCFNSSSLLAVLVRHQLPTVPAYTINDALVCTATAEARHRPPSSCA